MSATIHCVRMRAVALHQQPNPRNSKRGSYGSLSCGRPRPHQSAAYQGPRGRHRTNCASPSSSGETQDSSSIKAAPKGSFLANPRIQEVAFASLSVTSALLGVLSVFGPNVMCLLLLGGPAPELELIYTRIAGLTLACAAVAEGSLADAAANGRLESATYQRLMAACMGKSVLYVVTLALHPAICTPQLLALFVAANSFSIGVHSTVYQQTNKGKDPPFPWTEPSNPAAIIYTIIGVLYVLTAMACLLPPTTTASVFAGKVTLQSSFLQHLWAPGYLLSAALCYILKDAAERGRLSGGTFRRLNLGLCILELGFSIQLGTAMAGGLAPLNPANYVNLAVSQLVAAYTGWQWRFTVKPLPSPRDVQQQLPPSPRDSQQQPLPTPSDSQQQP